MPVMKCTDKGKPGYKFGESGKCYTYTPGNSREEQEAKRKAVLQGVAIGKGKLKEE
jgi:hypothetical protein